MKIILIFSFLLFFVEYSFNQFLTPTEITSHHNSSDVVVDFDQDGDFDFIGILENVFFFRNDGTGNFEKIQLTNSWDCENVQNFLTSDMNNDNFPDIVCHSSLEGETYYYINDGNGGIGNRITIDLTSDDVTSIELFDYDNNGFKDIIGRKSLSSYRVYKNMGSSIFIQFDYSYTCAVSTFADMDFDGDTDMFLSGNAGYNTYQIRFNDGFGNYDDTTNFSGTFSINQPKIIDIDLDGDHDFIYNYGGNVRTLTNNGSYQFGSLTSAPGIMVDVKDINYDGYPDVILGSNVPSTLYHGYMLNNGDGTFANATNFNFVSSPPLSGAYNNLYYGIFDFDNNGFLDILLSGQILFKSSMSLNFNNGIKIFERNTNEFGLIDINQDSIEDIYYETSDRVDFKLGQIDGTYSPEVIEMGPLNGYDGINTVVADFNSDGKDDLFYQLQNFNNIMSLHLFINNGDSTFLPVTALASVNLAGKAVVADIDNDNYPDILYRTTVQVIWLKNLGNLTFAAPEILYSAPNLGYGDIQCVDIDNDADVDIVIDKNLNPGFEIIYLSNDGNGAMSSPVLCAQNAVGSSFEFILEDVNSDGNDDLLVIHYNAGSTIKIYNGNGTGSFVYFTEATCQSGEILVVDVNMDNYVDICTYGVSINFQDSMGYFSDGWICPELLEMSIENFVLREINNDLLFVATTEGIYLSENNFQNLLIGELYVDLNNNGNKDISEPPIPYKPTQLLPINHFYFTNSSGKYTAPGIMEGNNQLIPPIISNFGLSSIPTQYNFTSTNLVDSLYSCSFGYSITTIVEELEVDLIGNSIPCNTIGHYWVNIGNLGTTLPSGVVELELDSLINFVSSSFIPDSIIGQHIYWTYDSINFFTDINFDVLVLMPDFTNMGDTMSSQLNVHVIDALGLISSTYSDSISQILTCAYDPNDKTVEPIGIGPEGYIPLSSDWMEYTIRFQNTGTDTAGNVVIRDHLDSDLNWESLEPIASSFPAIVTIDNEGIVSFVFNQINLPDSNSNELASHGFVRYKIRIKNGAIPGTKIHNSAGIYFDYNPPVITNSVLNTLFICNDTFVYSIPTIVCNDLQFDCAIETDSSIYDVSWALNGTFQQVGLQYSYSPISSGLLNLGLNVIGSLCSYDTTFQITVNESPMVQIAPFVSDTICIQNGLIELPVASPINGVWSGMGIVGNQVNLNFVNLGLNYYAYSYSNLENCFDYDSISIFIEDCLGFEERFGSNMQIYPNPFQNSFTISFDKVINGEIDIMILNAQGNIIYNEENLRGETISIECPLLSDGIYFIYILNNENGKFVIRKMVKD